MTVFWRYWLLQIPGWGVLAVALAAAHRYLGLPVLWAIAVFGAWLLKDWAFYPVLKKHYHFRADEPSESLVGVRATAREPLRPRGPKGYVQLRGELWLAELAKGAEPVDRGDEVAIEAVDGLTLKVRRVPSAR